MYIVTGGAGFIGSVFISRLNEFGANDILVVDDLGSSDKWQNLQGKVFSDYLHKAKFRELLLSNADLGEVDAIIHLGACSSTTETNAEYVLDNNYRYSRTVAEWAVRKNVRLVYASSAATYGDGSHGFNDDEDALAELRPLNVYGFSKHLFDRWVKRNNLFTKVAGLKFFNVFGPNEYHKGDMRSVVLKAKEQIDRDGKVRLFKSYRAKFRDGEQKRDFVYVKDCAEVIWWLVEHPDTNGLFNLGSGEARSWLDLIHAVAKAMHRSPEIEFVEMPEAMRAKYQYFTEANMAKLRASGCPVQFRPLENAVLDYVKNHLTSDHPVY